MYFLFPGFLSLFVLFLCTFQKCYWFALVANRGCKWCDAAMCDTNGNKKKIKEGRKCYKCWTPDLSVITNTLKELRVFLGKRTLDILLLNEFKEAKNEKTGSLLPCHAHLCSSFLFSGGPVPCGWTGHVESLLQMLNACDQLLLVFEIEVSPISINFSVTLHWKQLWFIPVYQVWDLIFIARKNCYKIVWNV